MSDKPREWPNNARTARDRAAEEAVTALKALEPLIGDDRIFTERERDLRISRAINALQKIARHLESVGAPTKPE